MKKKNVAVIFLTALMALCLAFVGCNVIEENSEQSKKVTFMVNGESYKVCEIKDGVCEMPENPVIEGYKFNGWFYDEQGTNAFVNSGLTEDVIVYGLLEKEEVEKPKPVTYKIIFDSLGGSDVSALSFTDFNVEFNLKSERKGYVFDGWYIDKEYTKPLLLEGKINSEYFKDVKEITVYAKWNEFIPESLASLFEANMKNQIANYTSLDLQDIQILENVDYKNYAIESAVTNNATISSDSGYFIAIALKDKAQNADFLAEMNKANDVYLLDDLMGFVYDKRVAPLYSALVYGYELVDGVYYSDNKSNIFAVTADVVNLKVPSSVKEIGCYALGDASITSVKFENNSKLERLDDYSFWKCKISTITLPEGLKYIGKGAFTLNSLTSIKIPASVNEMGYYPFNLCKSLETIEVDANNATFVSENGVVLNSAKDTLLIAPTGFTGEITVPATVKTIGKYAFVSAQASSVILNSGLELIDEQGFSGMDNLSTITIPNTVKAINYAGFSECVMLTEVLFEENSTITLLGEEAFGGSALQSIIIPASVEEIGISCFGYIMDDDTGMACLSSVEFEEGSKIKTIEAYAFAYSIIDEIVLPAGIEYIGEYLFMEAKSDIEDDNYDINVYIKDGALNEDWNSEWNVPIFMETINVYYYSSTEPTAEMADGDGYWYYGDGVITLW